MKETSEEPQNPPLELPLHHFNIQLEGVTLEEKDGKFILKGIQKKPGASPKAREGIEWDAEGNIVFSTDPRVLDGKGFSSLDNNFAYLCNNTNILDLKVLESKTMERFDVSNFSAVKLEQVDSFQKQYKGQALGEWLLRNPCAHNYPKHSLFSDSKWRGENTQNVLFQSLKTKKKMQEAYGTDNAYPEVRYIGPMNIYQQSIMFGLRDGTISCTKEEDFTFIKSSFLLDPPRTFLSGEVGKKTANEHKIEEYNNFLDAKVNGQGKKVFDMLQKAIENDGNEYFTKEEANKILKDYCDTQTAKFQDKDTSQKYLPEKALELSCKMLALGLKHQVISKQDIETIIENHSSEIDKKKTQNQLGIESFILSLQPEDQKKFQSLLSGENIENLKHFSNSAISKLPDSLIGHIVKTIATKNPEMAATVLLHLGDQKKSQAALDSLPNKEFAKVISAENFVSPYSADELKKKVNERLGANRSRVGDNPLNPDDFFKLLHGDEIKGIRKVAQHFLEKNFTKKQQYKTFIAHTKKSETPKR